MRDRVRNIVLFVSFLLGVNCKTSYNPGVISLPGKYLVVEGTINSGDGPTIINLSYAVNLSNKVTLNPVSDAIVSIQSDQNVAYTLLETKDGQYETGGLNLSSTNKYRLSITVGNEQYYSDYVPVLNAPPIDSVYYTIGANGIVINSSSHDPTNTTQYYRWDYNETYIIHSNFDSRFISTGSDIVPRDYVNDEIYTCWITDTSSTIVLNSSAQLKNAVIVNNPIASINSVSEKIGVKYSILVRQYALTGDAYTFWTNLKKNTEQLGSIFDAQPSEVSGNIHAVNNPAQPVIGYISVGIPSEKRIFISKEQLPNWHPTNFYPQCELDSFLYAYYPPPPAHGPINQVAENFYYNTPDGAFYADIPVEPIISQSEAIIGYTGSTSTCVDCTLRGTNKQPAFWK